MKRRLSTDSPPPESIHPSTSVGSGNGVPDISNISLSRNGNRYDLPSTSEAGRSINPTSQVSSTARELPSSRRRNRDPTLPGTSFVHNLEDTIKLPKWLFKNNQDQEINYIHPSTSLSGGNGVPDVGDQAARRNPTSYVSSTAREQSSSRRRNRDPTLPGTSFVHNLEDTINLPKWLFKKNQDLKTQKIDCMHPPTRGYLSHIAGFIDSNLSGGNGVSDVGDQPSTSQAPRRNPTAYVSSTARELPSSRRRNRDRTLPGTSFVHNLEDTMNLPKWLFKNNHDPESQKMNSSLLSTALPLNCSNNLNGNVGTIGTIGNNPQQMNQLTKQMLYTIPSPQEIKQLSILNWIKSLPSTSSPESENTQELKLKVGNGSRNNGCFKNLLKLSKTTKSVATVVQAPDVPISIEPDSSDATVVPILNSANLLPVYPTASPPHPPNWYAHLEDTELSLLPFKLFPISSYSSEYTTLQEMLNPLQITAVEQIVNPTLWSRFVNTRKDMLQSKSDDLELLLKLGFDESVVMKSAHVSLNFEKDAAVQAYPYNDNLTLLFHCTSSLQAIDSILSQGLDERLGRTSGRLGRGIYFSDDPKKAICYDRCHGIIFVFAVILGDCLSVTHMLPKANFVKEPEKSANQKRNFNDFNFDSIYARTARRSSHSAPNIHSEYVVYNRYQCCPLYKVQYKRGASDFAVDNRNQNGLYSLLRNKSPTFVWKPTTVNSKSDYAIPNQLAKTIGWPFFAETVFNQMNNKDLQIFEKEVVPESSVPVQIEDNNGITEKLGIMLSLGFNNTELNLETLRKNDYNVNAALNLLTDRNVSITVNGQPSGLEPHITNTESHVQEIKTFSNKDILNAASCSHQFLQNSECSICYNEYEITPANWSILQCSHKLCVTCHNKIETTRTTMAQVQHTCVKCPFCLETSGIEIGTCPSGTMTTHLSSTPCAGYEKYDTISIMYHISDPKYRLKRTAYLPNNDEGRKILDLLRIAWDRRLCFSIGTSNTTGRKDVLVWNIHHKTSKQGGIEKHGYPDTTYLDRVKSELKVYCIE